MIVIFGFFFRDGTYLGLGAVYYGDWGVVDHDADRLFLANGSVKI